ADGAGNTIANNGAGGVVVFGDALSSRQNSGNAILGNSIFNNALSGPTQFLGIDLVEESSRPGVTANDLGDGDTGPNLLQNAPVITSAMSDLFGTTIVGTLNSQSQT